MTIDIEKLHGTLVVGFTREIARAMLSSMGKTTTPEQMLEFYGTAMAALAWLFGYLAGGVPTLVSSGEVTVDAENLAETWQEFFAATELGFETSALGLRYVAGELSRSKPISAQELRQMLDEFLSRSSRN